jgi:hypothetical protein
MLNIGRQTIEVVWLNATLAARRPKTYDPGEPGVNGIFRKNAQCKVHEKMESSVERATRKVLWRWLLDK